MLLGGPGMTYTMNPRWKKNSKKPKNRQTELYLGLYWDLHLFRSGLLHCSHLVSQSKGRQEPQCWESACFPSRCPPARCHHWAPTTPLCVLITTPRQPPAHGQPCTVCLHGHCLSCMLCHCCHPAVPGMALTFLLCWQGYRQAAVENNRECQPKSDILFKPQENAQGLLWSSLVRRLELPTMTMCKFSLILAQLLIGRGSDLNSTGEAQLFPNVKATAAKPLLLPGW